MEEPKKRQILLFNLIIAAFILSVMMLVVESIGADRGYQDLGRGIDLFGDVYSHVLNNYVDEMDAI